MVTGWGAAIDQSEIDRNGVDGLLPKPFDIDNLLSLVDRLTEVDR
jgi:DNA-binding response OmpR family regulator